LHLSILYRFSNNLNRFFTPGWIGRRIGWRIARRGGRWNYGQGWIVKQHVPVCLLCTQCVRLSRGVLCIQHKCSIHTWAKVASTVAINISPAASFLKLPVYFIASQLVLNEAIKFACAVLFFLLTIKCGLPSGRAVACWCVMTHSCHSTQSLSAMQFIGTFI